MLPDRFSSTRARAAAVAVAFSVVAGGVAFAAAPSFATTTDAAGEATASTIQDSITPDTATIPVSASGFTPGNVVYFQVQDPNGDTNWSWNSATQTVGEDGTLEAELEASGEWAPGSYTVTVFESDAVQASFPLEVVGDETTTPTPTETETATPEPTESATPTEEPAATETPTETPTEEPTATETPSEEPAPPVEEPGPSTDAPAPTLELGTPTAWADATNYSAAEAAANGVGYQLSGFTPGVELTLVLTLPDGSSAEFESSEPIVPAADGTYAGIITYAGDWPAGEYTVTLRTVDGAVVPVDVQVPAETEAPADPTATDPAAADPAATDEGTEPAPGEEPDASGDSGETREVAEPVVPGGPAPIQEASFVFTVDAAQGGGGSGGSGTTGGTTNGGSNGANDSLAQTGADDVFGIAGIGLLVALVGAGTVATARYLGRRRDV